MRSLFGIGIIGTIVAALCCFTPVLVISLGAVGLSAVTGYLDYVLFPALGFFILLTIIRGLASSMSSEINLESSQCQTVARLEIKPAMI